MQGTPTSRKSGSNAPYRPINFECARGACACRLHEVKFTQSEDL
jgi:hypothetical protein